MTTTLPTVTIIHIAGQRYSVSLGGGTYTVTADGLCQCKGFMYRGKCRHIDALRERLEQERACGVCHGLGFIQLRERYADARPIECVACDGTGLREGAALPSQAALRAMFG